MSRQAFVRGLGVLILALFFIAVEILILFGCGKSHLQEPDIVVYDGPDAPDAIHYRCHVDTSFTSVEREHLENASLAWRLLTRRRRIIDLSFDFDISEMSKVKYLADGCLIVKVYATLPMVSMEDAKHTGEPVLALTYGEGHSAHVYFVADRLPNERYISTATHEFGHILGLDDLSERGHLMSRVSYAGGPEWFTAADMAECERVKACVARK